jgi:hypothetical protein
LRPDVSAACAAPEDRDAAGNDAAHLAVCRLHNQEQARLIGMRASLRPKDQRPRPQVFTTMDHQTSTEFTVDLTLISLGDICETLPPSGGAHAEAVNNAAARP